ncbi:hypothetical protein BH10ACT10_BH10ACT10_07430 [soil metagenome]
MTLGIGLGMLEWGPLVVLGCLAAVSVVTIPAAVVVQTLRTSSADATGRDGRRGTLTCGVILAAAVVAYWAVVRMAPSLALLLLTVALVTSPAGVRLARSMSGRGASRTARVTVRPAGATPRVRRQEQVPPAPVREPPHRLQPRDLDDRTLCRLWRQSFWELAGQSTPAGYLGVVAWRQCCLDEMERRDAHALQAWLESGARASSGPEKFLRHPPGGTTDAA